MKLLNVKKKTALYRAFHGFGKAKFAYGGSILGSGQFSILPGCLKNSAWFKISKYTEK
jgi:hypothetical protein